MGLSDDVARGAAIVGGAVLVVGGFGSLLYACLSPLRRRRRINKARTVHNRTQIDEVLAGRKGLGGLYLPVFCKLQGKVVVLPGATAVRSIATGAKVAVSSVRETRVTSETYVDRAAGKVKENKKESVTHEVRECPWVLELPDNTQVHVDTKGAELDLERVSKSRYLKESILRDESTVFVVGYLTQESNGNLVVKKQAMFWHFVSHRSEEECKTYFARRFTLFSLGGMVAGAIGAYLLFDNLDSGASVVIVSR
eukprot:comp21238_c0_seq1/m.28923 comp21238_c0_seq1/g.28923  ORF comp21238_c0_seq1/g.28923 comp21238_c0_seq1/m.28923 type:complete len:253 (-) comp21238_c0_seq1:427-1185(-)